MVSKVSKGSQLIPVKVSFHIHFMKSKSSPCILNLGKLKPQTLLMSLHIQLKCVCVFDDTVNINFGGTYYNGENNVHIK